MNRKCTLGWMAMLAVMPGVAYAGGPGPATLQLVFDQPCYAAGATATASVRMVNLGSPASGFQAFLGFDTARLTFTGGTYTSSPFGLAVISPITVSGGNIDLASGINQLGGQSPTMADSTLATLTFMVNTANDCAATTSSLFFRPHDPPSRVASVDGQSLLPLTLVDTPVQNNGPATIRLVYDKACYQMGETVNVAVRVEDICSPAAGFQAFLNFDTTKLAFVSGSYTDAPFGLPVITPITASGSNIDIASGINQLGGQAPMVGSDTVANLKFTALTTTACATTTANITFRTHDPPSRVTTLCGTELTPLTLIDTPVLNTGPATLRISFDKSCYVNNAPVVATIHMENLCTPAAGFQAFLSYDINKLTFVSWSYEPSPFGLPVLNTFNDVRPAAGLIDVASGINQLAGQNPTTANSVLVRLTFTAIAGADCMPVVPIAFRPHDPPTRATTICGTELLPLTLAPVPAVRFDNPPTLTPTSIGSCYPDAQAAIDAAEAATTAFDLCDGARPVSASVAGTCSAVVTVTATDTCGNSASITYNTRIDGTAPTLTPTSIGSCYPDAQAAIDAAEAATTAFDLCDGARPVSASVAGTCSAVVTVTATDTCGNSASITYNTRIDGTAPTLTPTSIGSCYPDAQAAIDAAEAATTAFDLCDGARPVSASVAGTCSAVVTVTATDTCGNSASITYNTRIDGDAPVITPGSIAACYPTAAAAEAAALAATSANDICDGPAVITTASTVGTCSAVVTVTSTDTCGNSASITYNTRIDNTMPTVTAGTLPDDCYGSVATAEAAAIAATTATDNCPGTVVKSAGTVGTCTAVITVTGTDFCGNSASVTYNTIIDSTLPSITCPDDLTVNADAGLCSAVVTPGTPIYGDNCDQNPSLFGLREDFLPLDAPYPVGATDIEWVVLDFCGNARSCTQTITVLPRSAMLVSLELSPIIDTAGTYPQTIERCITFELWRCAPAAPPVIVEQTLTFTRANAAAPMIAEDVEVLVPTLSPCGAYTCITARDRLHTLRRTLPAGGGFGVAGVNYVADFIAANKPLLGGNLNDDGVIDALDYGIFVGQFNNHYDGLGGTSPAPFAPDSGDTACGTYAGFHADISGNGRVFGEDFTFIQTHFLVMREPNCCGAPNVMAGGPPVTRGDRRGGALADTQIFGDGAEPAPITSITLRELEHRGLGYMAIADLNRDGVLDQLDIAAFAAGARP